MNKIQIITSKGIIGIIGIGISKLFKEGKIQLILLFGFIVRRYRYISLCPGI